MTARKTTTKDEDQEKDEKDTGPSETKVITPGENKAPVSAREATRRANRDRAKPAYGEATKEEHRQSGYRMPDAFYEVPAALEEHKDTSTERGRGRGTERDAPED